MNENKTKFQQVTEIRQMKYQRTNLNKMSTSISKTNNCANIKDNIGIATVNGHKEKQ